MKRRRYAVVAAVLAAVGLAAAGTWRLTWLAPRWWSPPAADNARAAAVAESVEYRVAEEAHALRPPEEAWWARIRQSDANAWLALRLPEWIEHRGDRWPAAGPPQVRLLAGAAEVTVPVAIDGTRRYVTLRVVPRVIDGRLALFTEGVALGRLWLPADPAATIAARLRDWRLVDAATIDETLALLTGRRRIDPTLELPDGRRVRVLELRCEPGALLLRCRTDEPAPP